MAPPLTGIGSALEEGGVLVDRQVAPAVEGGPDPDSRRGTSEVAYSSSVVAP